MRDFILDLFQYPVFTAVYILFVLISWYGLLALWYGLNSGQLGRGRWWVFECLWEDVQMNIPGGSKIKADRIRAMVGESGHGSMSRWSYEELRETGEYEKCGQYMFGPAWLNWLLHAFVLLLASCLGPIVISILIPLSGIAHIRTVQK